MSDKPVLSKVEGTLHEAIEEHLEYLKAQGKSERTIYTYGKDFEQVEAFFGPNRKLSAILVPHVGSFLKSDALLKMHNDKDRSEITVKKTVRVFRTFLVWAKEQGYIDKLPLPKDVQMGRSLMTQPEVNSAEPDPAPAAE
jgi:site-specific recombinase XerD